MHGKHFCSSNIDNYLLLSFLFELWPTLIMWLWTGLSRLTTDEKLKEAFAPFGQLVYTKVITDRATGRSKGFGFVSYTSIEEAERARGEMNAKYLDGWVIFVDPAKSREARPPPPPYPEQQPSETGFRTNKTIGWSGWYFRWLIIFIMLDGFIQLLSL